MDEIVSIVVPIYNREKFLDKCIKSILAQIYKNLEVILIDDGSKDNSLNICYDYAKLDRRIKVIHKENGGVQSARNRGIEEAKGKYICFIDADDYVTPKYIQNFIDVYEMENVECVVCGHIRIDENGNIIVDNENMSNLNVPKSQYERWALYFERFACYCWNHMFLLDVIKSNNVRFDKDIIIFDDTAFTMNYLNNIDKIGFTNSNDYYYVIEHNELTVTKMLNKKRVNDTGCKEKVITCIKKYNKYVKLFDLNDASKGNVLWLSSVLYHISMISFILYMATINYDYRFDRNQKESEFDYFYDFVKREKLSEWHYDYSDLHTKLDKKLLVITEFFFFKMNKRLFRLYSLLIGSRLVEQIRINIRKRHKKW